MSAEKVQKPNKCMSDSKVCGVFILFAFLLSQCNHSLQNSYSEPKSTHKLYITAGELKTYSPIHFHILNQQDTISAKQVKIVQPENGTAAFTDTSAYLMSYTPGDIRIKLLHKENRSVIVDTVLKTVSNNLITEEWYRLKRGQLPSEGITSEEQYITFHSFMVQQMRNKPFPDFELKTPAGETVTHNNLRGKVSLIYFWFFNCPHCKPPMEILNQAVEKYADNNQVNFYSFFSDSIQVTDNNTALFESKKFGQKVFRQLDREFNFTQLGNAKGITKKHFI